MAIIVREWLIRVLQYSEPFVSSKDINKGAQWLVTISDQLKDTSEGIVCVTPSNVEAPWLNYEAGALAKTTGQTAVRTLLLGLKPSDLPSGVPLSNFQHTDALEREEMWSLIESVHTRSEAAGRGDIERIRWAFDQAWVQLKDNLQSIDLRREGQAAPIDARDEKDLIKDVLREIKELSIAVAGLSNSSVLTLEDFSQAPRSLGAPLPKEVAAGLSPGMQVEHSLFGTGTVLATEGSGNTRVAKVRFEEGQKRLLLRYAPLTVLS